MTEETKFISEITKSKGRTTGHELEKVWSKQICRIFLL